MVKVVNFCHVCFITINFLNVNMASFSLLATQSGVSLQSPLTLNINYYNSTVSVASSIYRMLSLFKGCAKHFTKILWSNPCNFIRWVLLLLFPITGGKYESQKI